MSNFINCEPIFSCVMYWILLSMTYYKLFFLVYIIFKACTSFWI